MDIRRLKEQASRLSADGRYERAEVLYRQMLTLLPRDANLWLRHAELLKRLDRIDPSITSYRMAAQLLMDAGHSGRAIACLKMALALKPDDIDLVTDIIRFELRERQHEREHPEPQPEPLPPESTAEPEAPPALLALPMFVSSDSRITSLIPELHEPIPEPRPSAPRIPLEVDSPLQRWPQVRRVSDTEVAIKASPFAHWVVVTAASNLDVRFFEQYPVSEDALWLEEPSR